MTPKLELVALSKTYDVGNVFAVDDVSMSIAPGETLALLGPSGCGKSTTLNMIVGLETPTAGDILIDGQSVIGVPAGQRNVGLVFQDYAVFTQMTVAKNLSFGLEVKGVKRAEIKTRVAEIAELLDLGHMLDVPTSRLGGSELQRVAIGRTLVTKPALLLLDEPLSNLETEMRASMRRELRRLQAEIGLTIIYVTHDQVEALSLARRIAVMSNGKLRQCDLTNQVYEQPAHTFVGSFIGDPPMNLIEAVLDRSGAETFVTTGALSLPVNGLAAGAPASGRVVIGLRADALRLVPRQGSVFTATVERVEPRGADAVVSVRNGSIRVDVMAQSGARPEEGDHVGLDVDLTRLVLFHGDSRRNLSEASA